MELVPDRPPMTVVRLEVDSFKRLRAARITPTPTGVVPVRGKNAQGKSSLIEAMEAAFDGAEAKQELPITEGAHGARVVVDLGEIVVKRTWTRDSGGKATTKLVVEGAQGGVLKSPQAVLDALRARFADPVRFQALPADEQVREVLRGLGLAEELKRLEQLAEEQFERRRDVGRDLDRARKAVALLAQEAGMFQAGEVADAGKSAAELTAELQAAKDHNAALEQWARARDEAARMGKTAAGQVAQLRAQLQRAEAHLEAARKQYTEAAAVLAGTPPVDVAPLVAQMNELAAVERRRTKLDVLGKAREQEAQAAASHAEVEGLLESTRAQIAQVLAGAQFPVDGMSYDPESKTLLVNGIPFSQASHAERLRISVAIAMASSPAIRVAFIREGSMLDEDSLALVARLAQESGFQVWCEVVDSKREGAGVWIEDGEASQPGPEPDGLDAAVEQARTLGGVMS